MSISNDELTKAITELVRRWQHLDEYAHGEWEDIKLMQQVGSQFHLAYCPSTSLKLE